MVGFLSKRQQLAQADSLQADDDETRKAAEDNEKRLAKSLLAAILLFRRQTFASIAISVQYRTLTPLRDAVDWSKLATDLRVALQPSFDAFTQAAKKAAEQAGHPFDPLAGAVVAQQKARRDALIKQVIEQSKRAVDGIVVRGMQTSATPESVVRRVKDVIGLNDQQARALENYRKALEGGNKTNALARALRDQRYDDAVASLDKKPLRPEQIDAMVEGYARRLAKHRMEQIAATETMRAANQGAKEAWKQAQAAKPGMTAIRFWLTARDELVCPICRSIPLLNPNGVGLDEPFLAINEREYFEPPDPHPQCRCTIRFKWKYPGNDLLLGRH